MSSAVWVKSCRISFAVSGELSVLAATASRPAETSSPAIPELRPVASEEHDVDETETATLAPKLVQPLKYSHDSG